MKKQFIYLTILLINLCIVSCERYNTQVHSPDDTIVLDFQLDESGAPFYKIFKKNEMVLDTSRLGFKLKGSELLNNFKILDIVSSSKDETWTPIWGEESEIRNHYNELKICLQERSNLKRKMNIIFRVFDDGFGFRYEFPEQENLKEFAIMDEITEFAMRDNHTTWSIPVEGIRFYEGLYEEKKISELKWISTPTTFETKEGLFLAIHEANLNDYAAMNLKLEDSTSYRLKTELTPWSTGEKVFVKDNRVSPWRTMIIADKPGDLLLSRLMLNLNEPCQIQDTSWIKTGRYIGIWWAYHMKKNTWYAGPKHGATTKNVIDHIDFAAKHNFQGVLVEGWNEDWATWNFNFTKAYENFDLAKITEYAHQKGVSLIGHHETGGRVASYEAQMEDAFSLYQKHGVNVVKTGYVDDWLDGKELHSSQYGVRHFRKVIELAAKHHIMIDNHEPVMPTGLQRTYPNLMTQEGLRGQEWDAWDVNGGNPPSHTTIIPFTRGLAGPMDFTPGTFKFENPILPQTRVWTTLAKQLALFVVIYSPWQMASDMVENYEKYPDEFEFITSCPTDWSKTVIPHAKIGEYVTIARKDKNSDNWYVGSITNEKSRELTLSLDFLDTDVAYKAKIFKDGDKADFLKKPDLVTIEEVDINSESVINLRLASGGGTAIIITKK